MSLNSTITTLKALHHLGVWEILRVDQGSPCYFGFDSVRQLLELAPTCKRVDLDAIDKLCDLFECEVADLLEKVR